MYFLFNLVLSFVMFVLSCTYTEMRHYFFIYCSSLYSVDNMFVHEYEDANILVVHLVEPL